ncbi:hypothetical protein IMG5_007950 [Ichthyophthirius multifiliis]|uniref:Uncharacterized protein n=1 Tax=Ichthyophthirius multifiliis TaxID=5932 RepID=G0QJR7_ICHMU|nr:hypothetical protein IMG5_007950 [Ichthyophthirius multifiliis]EGR34536.1 hypothetical protein IMG5_007950 [Ichthyophthirius multifiliis]|eukprot:XP_004039840.1 hypothetical protein IMG5_007950 [Ichthyophthirius multifiliis]
MGCGTSNDSKEPRNLDEEDLQMEYNDKRENANGQIVNKYQVKENKPEEDQGLFELQEKEEGEQFMAVKPWIGVLKEPSNRKKTPLNNNKLIKQKKAPQNNAFPPQQHLKLEYVNGYRCENTRQNLYYTSMPNKIVYFSAAVGIILDTSTNNQEFFGDGLVTPNLQGHNDDIECLDISRDGDTVATGQRGQNPLIYIWSAKTKKVIHKIQQGRGSRLAKCIKFSPDGKYLFSVDESNDHCIHVYDVSSGQKLSMDKTGNETIMDIDTSGGSYACILARKSGCAFIDFNGNYLKASRGIFGAQTKIDMLSVAFHKDNAGISFSGSSKGSVYIWNGNQAAKEIQLHNGAIHAISVKDGLMFSSGAIDKQLKVLDVNTYEIQASHQLSNCARAIDYHNGVILVGTRNGCIQQINNGEINTLMNGHSTGETWGLYVDKKTGYVKNIIEYIYKQIYQVITSGDDNKVLVFNPEINKVIHQGTINPIPGMKKKIGCASTLSLFPPNQCSRAVTINHVNGHVAVATNDGYLSIRQSIQDLDTKIYENQISNEWIEVMHFSPDGNFLGIGSHDNNIYILSVNNNYEQVAVCSKHNSFITSFDWSCDGQYIQSNCGAYEYLFFQVSNGQQLQSGASQLRDEQWYNFTCKLGWPVQGVFPPSTDGSHVNGVSRSNNKQIFAVGDDWGFVNLYRNPCLKGNKCLSYRAHSSHVTKYNLIMKINMCTQQEDMIGHQ